MLLITALLPAGVIVFMGQEAENIEKLLALVQLYLAFAVWNKWNVYAESKMFEARAETYGKAQGGDGDLEAIVLLVIFIGLFCLYAVRFLEERLKPSENKTRNENGVCSCLAFLYAIWLWLARDMSTTVRDIIIFAVRIMASVAGVIVCRAWVYHRASRVVLLLSAVEIAYGNPIALLYSTVRFGFRVFFGMVCSYFRFLNELMELTKATL